MPALILTKSPSTHLPPQAAFTQQPSMRILKRPSASNSQSSSTSLSSSQPNGAETLKEREARYHAARERIFGGDTPPLPPSPSPSSTTDKAKPQTTSVVKVVREPRGPADGRQSTSSKGFGERKGKPPNAKPPNASSAGEGGKDIS